MISLLISLWSIPRAESAQWYLSSSRGCIAIAWAYRDARGMRLIAHARAFARNLSRRSSEMPRSRACRRDNEELCFMEVLGIFMVPFTQHFYSRTVTTAAPSIHFIASRRLEEREISFAEVDSFAGNRGSLRSTLRWVALPCETRERVRGKFCSRVSLNFARLGNVCVLLVDVNTDLEFFEKTLIKFFASVFVLWDCWNCGLENAKNYICCKDVVEDVSKWVAQCRRNSTDCEKLIYFDWSFTCERGKLCRSTSEPTNFLNVSSIFLSYFFTQFQLSRQ